MDYSEKELKKQETDIRKNLLLVFIPIAILILIIGLYQSNSLKHIEEKYLESHNIEFNGIVINKRQEGKHPRAGRFVLLDSYYEERVLNYTYDNIEIGDSVYKKKGSDTVYFHLKKGKIIIEDYNKFIRENYFDLLNER